MSLAGAVDLKMKAPESILPSLHHRKCIFLDDMLDYFDTGWLWSTMAQAVDISANLGFPQLDFARSHVSQISDITCLVYTNASTRKAFIHATSLLLVINVQV